MQIDRSSLERAKLRKAISAALFGAGASAALFWPDVAIAQVQPKIEVVIVTARKMAEDIQKVPATVTAIAPAELKQQNIANVYDLATAAPSLNVSTEFSSLLPNFALRGLSSSSGDVVTYFSDAPISAGTSTQFMDLGQIQILNGPQGTLFGRSSIAGAVLITPAHPELDRTDFLLQATVGDYGRAQVTGVANYPLIAGELGLRIAANFNHVDGYTRLIGASGRLDGINDEQIRVGLEFKKGGFDNYLVASFVNINQPSTSNILTAVNLNAVGGFFNVPDFVPRAFAPLVFGGLCAPAVALGFSPDINTCSFQRYDRLAAIKPALLSELSRVSAGGDAVRRTPAPYNGLPDFEREEHFYLVNVTEYDFGNLGDLNLDVKNVFSVDSVTNNIGEPTIDGVGGRVLSSAGFTSGPLGSIVGVDNYIGNKVVTKLSAPVVTYTEDFQIHLDVGDGLLLGTTGLYYSYADFPSINSGSSNLSQVLSGIFLPDLGYFNNGLNSRGGYNSEIAPYTQETLNLSRWIHGISLTGGFRYSWDKVSNKTFLPVHNYELPGFVPGTPGTLVRGPFDTRGTSTSGYNYTVQLAEQVNEDLMVYGAINRAYVPGGVNFLAQSVPGIPRTFGPETVLEKEVGAKFNVQFGDWYGRFGADFYDNQFSDIARANIRFINGVGFSFEDNIAAANLRGIEVYGTILGGDDWAVRFSYNYNEAHYKHWIGLDPFNVAQPGDPNCVPSSPPGTCLLDLKNNPFPRMPNNQGHITVARNFALGSDLGVLTLSATAYAQSREYFSLVNAAFRELELFPFAKNAVSQAPYATLNLRVDWHNDDGLAAGVFVTNVTDEVYATGKVSLLNDLGFAVTNYAPPRMFGVEVSYKFEP
jgi:iron complex outermembrane receptor protein